MTHSFQPNFENRISEGIHRTAIEGLFFIPHKRFDDDRGFYAELARIPEIEAVTKKPFIVKQTNMSFSQPNVIRGFHAEAWNKLLTVINGSCFCAWADIRPDSQTFGQVVTMRLGSVSDSLFGSVYVSEGLANSFCVLEGPANYLYAVDKLYTERDTTQDRAISLFDPDLAVPWPIPQEIMIYSERDKNSTSMRDLFPQKYPTR